METQWIRMEDPQEAERGYREAARLLRAGENVAFPTETVYGLGGWAMSEQGIDGIYKAKGRPSDNPLIVHVYPGYDLSKIVSGIPSQARELMDRFWPGPLTLLLEKAPAVSPRVTGGLPTVAIRMPDHPVALKMMATAGIAVVAPSANTSGRPSPTTAAHVYEDMKGKIPLILDAGPCKIGLESTIVDLTVTPPVILRPGGLTIERIRQVLPEVCMDPGLSPAADAAPKAPGMKYRHYAPRARMYMSWGAPEEQERQIRRALCQTRGQKRGVLTVDEHRSDYEAEVVLSLGPRENPDMLAARLFDALRRFDEERCEVLFAETIPAEGIGEAFMNRLSKACGGRRLEERMFSHSESDGDENGRTGLSD